MQLQALALLLSGVGAQLVGPGGVVPYGGGGGMEHSEELEELPPLALPLLPLRPPPPASRRRTGSRRTPRGTCRAVRGPGSGRADPGRGRPSGRPSCGRWGALHGRSARACTPRTSTSCPGSRHRSSRTSRRDHRSNQRRCSRRRGRAGLRDGWNFLHRPE